MCVFCDIVAGKIPSKVVYEDADTLAILDLSQTTKGHTLVMPKKHYENIMEMPVQEFANLMVRVQYVSALLMEKLGAKGTNTLINTNEISGQTVMHTHVHIIPRYSKDDTVKFEFTENKYNLDEVLAEIKK